MEQIVIKDTPIHIFGMKIGMLRFNLKTSEHLEIVSSLLSVEEMPCMCTISLALCNRQGYLEEMQWDEIESSRVCVYHLQ